MNLAYIEKGQGEAVIFLHGFCERKEIWNDIIDFVGKSAHALAPDLPGFGDNPALLSPMTIDRMAEQVHEWLREQGIHRGIMVGHSLGGYISLAFAEKYPEWMLGLGIFQSTAYADDEQKQKKRSQTAAFIERNGMEPFAGPFVRNLFHNPDLPKLKPMVDNLIAFTMATPASTAIEVSKAMRDRPDRIHVLKNATFPVLFIAGREDQAVPLAALEKQFLLPANTVTIKILPYTGHMAMVEQPLEAKHTLKSWVEGVISVGH